jgi:pyruvate formate lyase activating enzyme
VFFKGCPLRCIWCHNPESLSPTPQVAYFSQKCIGCGSCRGERTVERAAACPTEALVAYGTEYEAQELATILECDKPFFERSGGGVTLSGGECLAQPAFAAELARILRARGIGVYVDTCGYVGREALELIIPYTDVFLYDLKAIDPQVHRRCTGRDNAIILQNLKFLSSLGCEIEIRYPLVMGYNDRECEAIGAFLKDLKGIRRIKVLQYHAFAASRYDALGLECTLPETVTRAEDVQGAVDVLRSMGLPAVNGITTG